MHETLRIWQMLKGWQRLWLVAAVVWLGIVVVTALDERPTREQVLREWASALRRTVERSNYSNRFLTGGRGIRLKPGWQETRPEEHGTYAGLSDEQVVASIHRRYRHHLGEVSATATALWRKHSSALNDQPMNLPQQTAESLVESISRVDVEHEDELATLRPRAFQVIVSAVAWRWMLPLSVWYAVGFSARWWWPFVRRKQQAFGITLLVTGAGALVVGTMESDSFFGGVGAMMLVGGFLALRR